MLMMNWAVVRCLACTGKLCQSQEAKVKLSPGRLQPHRYQPWTDPETGWCKQMTQGHSIPGLTPTLSSLLRAKGPSISEGKGASQIYPLPVSSCPNPLQSDSASTCTPPGTGSSLLLSPLFQFQKNLAGFLEKT